MFEILNRFFAFCDKENRRKFHLAILIGVFNSFFMALRIAAVAVMMQGIIRSVTKGTAFSSKTIWLSFAIICISVIAAIITKKNMSMLQTEGGYRTCAKKRIEIAEHLRYLPMGYFNKNSLGQITSVTTNTMELVGDVATRAVMMVMQGLLDSALIIFMIFFFDWRIALVALAGFVLFQLVNLLMRLSVRAVSDEKNEADTKQVEKILEYIQGIAEVRAFNLTGSHRKELNQVIDRCIKICISMELRCIPISAIQSLVAKLTGVAIMLCSIFFYLSNTMEVSNCVVMLICSFMLFSALEAGGNYSALLRIIDIGVKKAQAILDLPTMDINEKAGENRMTDEIWYIIRNTRGVTGFVGPDSKPVPLTQEEVDMMLNTEQTSIDFGFAIGEHVRILSGPLENFSGVVEDVDTVRSKLTVKVQMFLGREMPVELDLDQVEKED